MQVTSHYVDLPLTNVNPGTVSVSRDNRLRELVQQIPATEPYPRQRSSDEPASPQLTYQRPTTATAGQQGSADKTAANDARTQHTDEADEASSADSDEAIKAADDDKQREGSQSELSEDEQQEVDELKTRDQEVRQHEQAHAAAGGSYAGAPSYDYEQGPDGKRYAVGGEVSIDVSKVAGDPEATVKKARQVRAAALAPAEPSAQDRRVAAEAQQMMSEAQQQMLKETGEQQNTSDQVDGNTQNTAANANIATAKNVDGDNAPSNDAAAPAIARKSLSSANPVNDAISARYQQNGVDSMRHSFNQFA